MTFPLVRPSSFIPGTRLLASEMNDIQDYLSNALDATGGGTYAMTAPIEFTSSTWTLPATTFTGAVTCTSVTASGAVVCNGNVTLGNAAGDTLTVDATATFNAPVTAVGNVELGTNASNTLQVNSTTDFGSACEFHGNLTLSGTTKLDGTLTSTSGMSFNGTETHTGTVGFSGTVNTTGPANLRSTTVIGEDTSDTLTVESTTTTNGPITANGAITATTGCSVPTRFYVMTDADTDVGWRTRNFLWIPSATLSTDRVATLLTSDVPVAGSIVKVRTLDAVNTVTIGGMVMKLEAASPYYAEFVYTGSSWQVAFAAYL